MNLTLAITPLNASAIPASWQTIDATLFSSATQLGSICANRLNPEDERAGFTRVLPQKATDPSAESLRRGVVNAAINRVRDRFGVHQAKHIIQVVGREEKMMSIEPDRFPHVLSVCRLLDGMQSNDPLKYHWIHRFDSNGAYLGFSEF